MVWVNVGKSMTYVRREKVLPLNDLVSEPSGEFRSDRFGVWIQGGLANECGDNPMFTGGMGVKVGGHVQVKNIVSGCAPSFVQEQASVLERWS